MTESANTQMNIATYILSMVVVLLVMGCAETSSDSRSRSGAGSDGSSTSNASGSGQELTKDDLHEKLLNREAQLNLEKDELAKLQVINEALCERINKINKECLPKKPITANSKIRLVSCDGNPVEEVSNSKIEVDIYLDGSGEFKLDFHSGNTIYQSSTLGPGTQELKFTNRADDQTLTPSFSDIKKMRLTADLLSSGSGSSATVTVDIMVDGKTVLKDIVPGVKVGGSYDLNVRKIYQQLISSSCQISNEALEQFLAPFNSSEGSFDNDKSSSTSSAQAGSAADIEQRIVWVEEALADLFPNLEAARNRSFNLKKALKGDTGVGCRLEQKITELSITIDGSPVIESVANKRNDRIEGSGNAKEIEIDLGGVSFASTIALGSTFSPDEDLTSLDIASLTKINLRKGGTSFINNLVKCDSSIIGDVFKKDNDCYDILEESVMDINKIKLEVNGLTLFEQGNLGLKLDRDRLTWKYESLQLNPKWGEMLLRNDCEATN
ncbi:MAG: hypothetical protein HRU09_10220 [Oligoflexales bacterium]|nr:hypothetical protein [Oligoflexales bacterium]